MPDPLLLALRRVFGEENVIPEFSIAKEATDGFDTERHYAPEPDYAVRPFNLIGDIDENNRRIDNAIRRHSSLTATWSTRGFRSPLDLGYNPNPRVFLAIEKEFHNTRKHRLGSVINASVLGKLGVVACVGDEAYRSISRIKGYLDFVGERKGRHMWLAQNVIVLRIDDMIDTLNGYAAPD